MTEQQFLIHIHKAKRRENFRRWWKVKMMVTQLYSTLRWIPYQLSHQGSPGILEWVAFPLFRGSSQPRDQTQVSHIAGGVFTSWVIRKPKNPGVGSLSFLQHIFLAKESNWDLLHCRRTLYQLKICMLISLITVMHTYMVYECNQVHQVVGIKCAVFLT